MTDFDMTGKVALITGGSRGLGRSMALGFARAGADIAIASRKLASCEATAREIEDRSENEADDSPQIASIDVTNADRADRADRADSADSKEPPPAH